MEEDVEVAVSREDEFLRSMRIVGVNQIATGLR